jgi:hypothetical protein
MAANKAAGRALAQGMGVQLQETGQRMLWGLIAGFALLFMAASPTPMPNAKCRSDQTPPGFRAAHHSQTVAHASYPCGYRHKDRGFLTLYQTPFIHN